MYEICPVNLILYFEGIGRIGDYEYDLTFQELHQISPYPREIVIALFADDFDPMKGGFFDGSAFIFTQAIYTNFDTFHLSCSSSEVKDWKKDVGGIIIYTDGLANGIKFKGGYVIV